MDEYVSKPIRQPQLLAALRLVLGHAESPEAGGVASLNPADDLIAPAPGVIDWNEALKICTGDHALLREIVQAFLEEQAVRLEEIRRAIDSQDYELLSRAAHTIKGSMRYFAAERVFERAFALEQLGESRDLTGADEHFEFLKQELATLVPHLINYVEGRGGPTPSGR